MSILTQQVFAFPTSPADADTLWLAQLSYWTDSANCLKVESAIADKSLAVSSLHKSIRRGEVDLALRAASSLVQLDPGYLFGRLPIIAYEDIGIANPELCLKTLMATSKRYQEKHGPRCLAYALVQSLAISCKSRTATDIICLTSSDPYANDYLALCKHYKPYQLFNAAMDTHLSLTHRMTAIQLICGYKVRMPNGYYVTHSKPHLAGLADLCAAMNVNDPIKLMVINGQGKTAGLNGSTLLAYELISQSQTLTVKNRSTISDSQDGVLLSAYDSYCPAGRQVIAKWYAANQALQFLCRDLKITNPTKFLGVYLFQTEGSLLNSILDFDACAPTRDLIETLELQEFSLNDDGIRLVKEIIPVEMPTLNRIRREAQVSRRG